MRFTTYMENKKPRLVANINKPLAIHSNILMFSDRDLEDVHLPYDDTLVTKVQNSNTLVNCVLVDNGSGFSVFFKDDAEKMGILDSINKGKTTLHTFNEASVRSLGTVKLADQAKPYNHLVTFHVMDYSTPNNAILGRN
ncbi:hypothetical protein ACFX2I_040520 [Malus domestica]